jgi:hypothetical protein
MRGMGNNYVLPQVPVPARRGMGGLFDWLSPSASSDPANGDLILKAYYDQASTYPGFQYSDYATFQAYFEGVDPGFTTDLGALVRMNYASTTVGQAQDREIALATASQGTANISDIIAAAGGKGDTINWAVAIPVITAESGATAAAAVETAVTTAANVVTSAAEGAVSTANMLADILKYLPYVAVGGGVIFLWVLLKNRKTVEKAALL